MKIKEWNMVKNWPYILWFLLAFALNISATFVLVRLDNYQGLNLVWASAALLVVTGLEIFLAGKAKLLSKFWQDGFLKMLAYVGLGFIAVFAVKIIAGIVMQLSGEGLNTVNQQAIEDMGFPPIILFLLTSIFAPTVEEIVFRGFIMGKIFGKESIFGLILSSLLFGLMHAPTGLGSWIMYGGMGLVLGLIYRLGKRLEYSMLVHFINNIIGFLLMLLMQMLMNGSLG